LIGAGILAPTIQGLQAIAEIPGLFTSADLPTDRVADFFERMAAGVTTRAEAAALAAGVPQELIADSHLLGEIIGFTVPVVGSLKLARMITRIQGPVLSLGRNLLLDTTAGAIFGAALRPEDNLEQRAKNTLRESAIFGVGGLVLNGLVFGVLGYRFARARAHIGDDSLENLLKRMANGERVVVQEAEVGPLVQLMNEEGFLANSLQAQRLLGNIEFEQTVVASVKGAAEAGQSRGIVQNIGRNFNDVALQVERMQVQFPNLKFDIVGKEAVGAQGGRTFDLHFGLKGLNNQQKSQLKSQGRYRGQLIQKNGTTYEYIRPGQKPDTIMVLTADKKITSIKRQGVTDLPYAVEDIALPATGKALYEDFREYVFNRMGIAAGVEGGLSEQAIIAGLRDKTLILTDEAERLFDIGGAITHPSELNLKFVTIGNPAQIEGVTTPATRAAILDPDGLLWLAPERASHLEASIDMVAAKMRVPREQAVEAIQTATPGSPIIELLESGLKGEFETSTRAFRTAEAGQPIPLTFASTAAEFSQNFLRKGKVAGDVLEPIAIRDMDSVFTAWAELRGLDLAAIDIEAFKQSFATSLRNDLWASAPKEDLAIFAAIRDEAIALLDAQGVTLAQRAATKGFHIDMLDGGRVAIRDINTGARIEFGTERFASDFIDGVVRSEKDPFGAFLSPGPHGMPVIHGGFPDPDPGMFMIDGNVLAADFLDNVGFASLSNRRDYLIRAEQATKMPLFSQGFGLIDQAVSRKNELLEPIGRRISAAWGNGLKKIKRPQKVQVADFWETIAGQGLTGPELVRAAQAFGLNSRQIAAFNQTRELFRLGDELLQHQGSFGDLYYGKIRPALQRSQSTDETIASIKASLDDPGEQAAMEFWEQYFRSGDLANLELDPEIVLHKYFRTLFYQQEVAPLTKQMRSMLEMKIKDLPQSVQLDIIRNSSLPLTTGESFVLPEAVRSVGQEYLVNIRGDGSPGFAGMRSFTRQVFKKLGMEVDNKLFDELHSTYLSAQYGAAIGLRFALMNRNAVQNLWMMYTRVGGKFGTTSLRRAMTQEGYDEAVVAGAIRPVQQSVAQGDAIYERFWASQPIQGTGAASMAMASGLRHVVRLGRVSRKASQASLIPYGSSDQINRAWAYHWQKLHTAEKLADFDAGKIDWTRFMDDGLPYFSDVIKRDFRRIFDKEGREAALQYIGKQASDEAHFIYGAASSPTWMQRPFGRLAGVFGQWPLWAYELYMRRQAHATSRQFGAFWVRSLALIGVFTNMTAQSGINMWNWMAPVSLEYGGGPFTDTLVDVKNVVDAPLDRKVQSLDRLMRNVGSLALPGQIFYDEISNAMNASNPVQGALMLSLGRPVDVSNFAYDWLVNPDVVYPEQPVRPGQLEGLQPIVPPER
jgi:hypothetical protein